MGLGELKCLHPREQEGNHGQLGTACSCHGTSGATAVEFCRAAL